MIIENGDIVVAADGPGEVHVTFCDKRPGAVKAHAIALSPARAREVAAQLVVAAEAASGVTGAERMAAVHAALNAGKEGA